MPDGEKKGQTVRGFQSVWRWNWECYGSMKVGKVSQELGFTAAVKNTAMRDTDHTTPAYVTTDWQSVVEHTSYISWGQSISL